MVLHHSRGNARPASRVSCLKNYATHLIQTGISPKVSSQPWLICLTGGNNDNHHRTMPIQRAYHSFIDVDSIWVADYFEAGTAPENRFILRRMGDIRDKRLLDLGCGAAENRFVLLKKGCCV